ncbi:uncharacterized protein LODBEIA_P58950 [Lodderomyces beijingensis]|uniref:Glutaredoxin domain-containing protein n=1 Tax=Lodderomyces beijingensis TaxID=1775926 RepID=A0ABP0ZW54_9ASCO
MFEWITSWFQEQPISPELVKSIESAIESNKVLVYSKTYCPYCRATKDLLNKHQVEYKLVELNTVPDGSQIQRTLQKISGQKTVPNIFINGKHIGGNSDLQALEQSKKLAQLLT